MDNFAKKHKHAVLQRIAAVEGPAEYPAMMDDVMKEYEKAGLVERHSNGNIICATLTAKGRAELET